ncbi:hypothetical protein ACIBAI_04950 [Streptomyces sp. NPDC051041]|uniref:hypothetical protein n=1 Tax=Streptomyces sp. NPDC051041 TaxID=3365640 RepID=UPI0037A4B2EB
MGERRSDGGSGGRRRAHPGHVASGPRSTADTAGLEALLAAVMRADEIDAEAEQRAVAAFRAARAAGAHPTRTRRRDDWRPRERWRAGRPPRVTFSVLLAGLALGGVAFAAVGTAGSAPDAGDDAPRPRPATSAPPHRIPDPAATASDAPAATASGTPAAPAATASGTSSGGPGRPGTARETEAHCRAYERVGGRGRALDARAWQRLVETAGGADEVAAYCAGRPARGTGGTGPGTGDGTPGPDGGAGGASSGAGGASSGAGSGNGSASTGAGGSRGNAGAGAGGAGAGAGEAASKNP